MRPLGFLGRPMPGPRMGSAEREVGRAFAAGERPFRGGFQGREEQRLRNQFERPSQEGRRPYPISDVHSFNRGPQREFFDKQPARRFEGARPATRGGYPMRN